MTLHLGSAKRVVERITCGSTYLLDTLGKDERGGESVPCVFFLQHTTLLMTLYFLFHLLRSGRRNWDGSGGTGAALRHYEATGKKYPLAVKLGTITPHGADVYSYASDDDCMVKVST